MASETLVSIVLIRFQEVIMLEKIGFHLNISRNTLLLEAKLDIVEYLIENKADVNSIGKSGRYPIESALKHRCLYDTPVGNKLIGFLRTYGEYTDTEKLISALLNAGAKLNLRNSGEDSPLHLAVCLNCPEIVRLLISNGADVNSIGVKNQTPLHRYVDHMSKENDLMRKEKGTSTYFRKFIFLR